MRIGPLNYSSFWPRFIDSLRSHPRYNHKDLLIARDEELKKYSARIVYRSPFDTNRYLEFDNPTKATLFIIKWGAD